MYDIVFGCIVCYLESDTWVWYCFIVLGWLPPRCWPSFQLHNSWLSFQLHNSRLSFQLHESWLSFPIQYTSLRLERFHEAEAGGPRTKQYSEKHCSPLAPAIVQRQWLNFTGAIALWQTYLATYPGKDLRTARVEAPKPGCHKTDLAITTSTRQQRCQEYSPTSCGLRWVLFSSLAWVKWVGIPRKFGGTCTSCLNCVELRELLLALVKP